MADQKEEVVVAMSPAPSDHKRKHDDLQPDASEPAQLNADTNGNSESESVNEADGGDDSEAKRPRLEDKPDGLATVNGDQAEKTDEPQEVDAQPPEQNNTNLQDAEQPDEEALKKVNDEELAAENVKSDQNIKPENAEEEPSEGKLIEHPEETQDLPADLQKEDVSSAQQQDTSEAETVSRKMEVPNNKVGVLIGKRGDTIRLLQSNSGARIQITRDADADPFAGNRPVELIGTLENINKAEKLIKDVIAEADAGGSPALVAKGFSTVQASGAGEQIEIQVPNEKVGLIIGKHGDTIKSLQERSGARIQLIPQHPPEGDQSKERIARVTGDRRQIEIARELITEVMDQTVRSSPIPSGYNNQQAFRPRGPAASQWGPRGPPPQQYGYDYQQRKPYQSQNPQYPPQAYGNYPPQQMAPRSNLGWGEQRRPATVQGGPPPHSGYTHVPGPSPAMGPPPQANYNYGQPQGPGYGQPQGPGYGQPQGPGYGQPAPYSQTAPPAQNYGHGYSEPKYENHVPVQQHQYGTHGPPQPSTYPQATTHPGYGPADQYGKPPAYGMPPQGQNPQSYGQPRATQPGDMPYQAQSYGQTYASNGQMQQTYPLYGSAPPADGYNHPQPAGTPAATPGYPQQGGQPVSGYVQPGAQQAAPGYAQVGPTGTYSQYPSSQPGYTEQVGPNNAAYGYQGPVADPAYGGGPAAAYGAPPAYSQPASVQVAYDQPIPQSGGYATVPAGVAPQPNYPQYDGSQMYGANR